MAENKDLFTSKSSGTSNGSGSDETPQFYEKGKQIKERMDEFYNKQGPQIKEFWNEASYDNRFEAGDQSAFFELNRSIPKAYRQTFNFNRIRRIVNMISGYQRQNRKSIIITPVENGDQQTADQYSQVISHIQGKQDVLDVISSSFRDALISGMSMLNLWIDYRDDPVSGSLKVDKIPYSSFLIDPYFKKKDLSDCSQVWRRSYLTKNQIISLLPDKKSRIMGLDSGNAAEKFEYMPEVFNVSQNGLLSYDEFYYMSDRKQKVLIDSYTGEKTEISESVDRNFLAEYLRYYPNIVVRDFRIPTVKVAILVQDVLMYDGPNQLGIDSYPFVPVFAYFNPSLNTFSQRVQSVVRDLRDPQFLYNRRKAIEDDIFSSQVNSGLLYKEDALVDPNDAYKTGQGKGIALKATASMSDVQKMTPPDVPQSMFQLSEQYSNEIMEISGVNEELLGSAQDEKAGILSMLRQGAGLTTLHELFDNLDVALKQLGRLMLKSIQTNYTTYKISQITQQQPTDQFYDKAFGIYDAAVEEGFDTTTQRQRHFAQLLQLKEQGVNIPDETLVQAATVQNKSKLEQDIANINQQQQQQQAEEKEVQNDLRRAQTNLANAQVESDMSLAKERDSKVFSNISLMQERARDSEHAKTESLLNIVQALKKMDSADLDNLTKLIRLNKTVSSDQKQQNISQAMQNSTALGGAIVSGATKDVPEAPERDPDKIISNLGRTGHIGSSGNDQGDLL